MIRNFFIRCMLMAVFCFLALITFAQGGTTGPLMWQISNETLYISGEGEMPDYVSPNYAPWFEYRSQIHKCVIEFGVKTIGNWAFQYCYNLTSITIPNSVILIKGATFFNCTSLTSITIPEGVKSIGNYAFDNCYNLTSITISNSVKNIGKEAFTLCTKLASITLPDSLESINDGTFSRCERLTSIIIPNSVTSIGKEAFFWCFGLTSIVIPNSVTNIGDKAFNNCTKLTSFTNLNPKPIIISPNVFGSVNTSICILDVPIGSVSAYKYAEVWKSFKNIGIYLVDVNVNNEEYGTVVGGGIFNENEIVSIEATAKSDFQFVNWSNNDVVVSADNPYTFTVKDDVELVANFVEKNGIKTIETSTVKVYPNPTTGELRIENYDLLVEKIKIFDIYGRNVLSQNVCSTQHTKLNISHLSTGVYFVKISTEAGEVVQKVVKE